MVQDKSDPLFLFKSIISPEQIDLLLVKAGLASLSEDRKTQMIQIIVETIILRILTRIGPILTEKDLDHMEVLEKEDNSDQKRNQFLLHRVPNLKEIVDEEIAKYEQELNTR